MEAEADVESKAKEAEVEAEGRLYGDSCRVGV
jgi:hypothetical protein